MGTKYGKLGLCGTGLSCFFVWIFLEKGIFLFDFLETSLTTHVCCAIIDVKGGELFYVDTKEKERGQCDINNIISIQLCYSVTEKEMKNNICQLRPKNKRKAKYVPQYSRFVHLLVISRPNLLFERSESFLTGQDIYNNLSRSQIVYLTKQHENDPHKLQNSDVSDFEKWKTRMWNIWYKNMNFLIDKWD